MQGTQVQITRSFTSDRLSDALQRTMILEGFFNGLEAQREITALLDSLYGSYGERLIATYKIAS
jgi:hypothetical protein